MEDVNRNNAMRVQLGIDDVIVCHLESPHVCTNAEARRAASDNLAEITAGQIKVSVVTAISGVVISTLFSIALISSWAWHSFHGNAMPDVPWFIISVVMVPFGSAMVMKIPKRVAYRIEERE